MGRLVLAHSALSDAGTISGAACPGSMSLANLLSPQPTDVARFSSLSGMYFEHDLGSAEAINLVWLGYTNASSAATWRVRAATSQANLTASPGQDTGAVSHWPGGAGLEGWPRNHAYLWLGASPWTYRWWRVDITDAGNPSGYYEAGRLYLSSAWYASRGLLYGWSAGTKETSRILISEGGQKHPRIRPRPQVISGGLRLDDENEMYDQAYEIQRARGVSEDVLLIVDPTRTGKRLHQWTCYGLLAEPQPIVVPTYKVYELQLAIEEMP